MIVRNESNNNLNLIYKYIYIYIYFNANHVYCALTCHDTLIIPNPENLLFFFGQNEVPNTFLFCYQAFKPRTKVRKLDPFECYFLFTRL
jgi:hypothetical protein